MVWDMSDQTLDFLARGSGRPTTISTTTPRHTFKGHKDFVLSVAYVGTNGAFGRVDEHGDPCSTPSGEALAEVEWVVSASKDWTVTFWDARSPPVAEPALFTLQGHVNSGFFF